MENSARLTKKRRSFGMLLGVLALTSFSAFAAGPKEAAEPVRAPVYTPMVCYPKSQAKDLAPLAWQLAKALNAQAAEVEGNIGCCVWLELGGVAAVNSGYVIVHGVQGSGINASNLELMQKGVKQFIA